jgi:formylglycine-generating enzyme required for sulfatase activity
LAAWERSDLVLGLLSEAGLHVRPISLRHPFIFYLGHLPAFAWNQLGRGVLRREPLRADFELLFERGIDPPDEESARAAQREQWPELPAILAYRDRVRAAVLDAVPEVLGHKDDLLAEHGRIVHMVIEHEQMHQETLLYMVQQCDLSLLGPPPGVPPLVLTPGRAAEARFIAGGPVELGADFASGEFGWDNEFGQQRVEVPSFQIDSLPVRNRDWEEFRRRDWSTAQGLIPANWRRTASGWQVRTVFAEVPLEQAADWPVQVSGAQARAYCAWQGGRLPTEAEFHRAAFCTPEGALRQWPWGDVPPEAHHGNFDFSHFAPLPVGCSPRGSSAWGVEELVGNGWEWTSTPFAPLPGFVAYARTYPGYSTDFFDGAHDVLLGGSWATSRKLLRRRFRNYYRRDYPHVFSSFRVVRAV